MKKLSKSTVVLIIFAAVAITLGIVLFFTMPESWSETFDHRQWIEKGTAHHFMFDGNEGFPGQYGRTAHRGGGFSLPFLIIIAAVLFFVFRGQRHGFGRRRNHSRAILDQMFAEEKITLEEYKRKRTIIEEDR
jgi:hypothetical protein